MFFLSKTLNKRIVLFFCLLLSHFWSFTQSFIFIVSQQNTLRHHWVHRRRQEGKCKQCGKVNTHAYTDTVLLEVTADLLTHLFFLFLQSFQQKFFLSKEIIAISCSWCKQAVSPICCLCSILNCTKEP